MGNLSTHTTISNVSEIPTYYFVHVLNLLPAQYFIPQNLFFQNNKKKKTIYVFNNFLIYSHTDNIIMMVNGI